jgi:hypothetical protein
MYATGTAKEVAMVNDGQGRCTLVGTWCSVEVVVVVSGGMI